MTGGGMMDKRLLELLAGSKRFVCYQVAWQWVSLACQITIVFTLANVLRSALAGTLGTGWLLTAVLVFAAALVVRFYADRCAVRCSFAASVDVKRVLRGKIYSKLLRLGASYRDHISTSELVQMTSEGAEQLETYFGRYLSQLMYSVIAPLTLFAVLFPYNWQSSLVLLVCVPLIPVAIVVVQKIARNLLGRYWDIYTDLGDTFLESLQGLTTLKIYQADAQRAERLDAESERFRIVTMKVLKMQLNSIIVMDVVAYAGAAAGMAVAICQYLAGNVDLVGVFMITLLASEFFIPMRLLGSFFHIAMNGMAASDKMFDFLAIEEPPGAGKAIGPGPVDIVFDGVSYSYDGRRRILSDVSLEFGAGTLTSLVGVSGCGKSTIVKLIMGRNRGYEGSVRVAGHELADVAEDSIMRSITMVSSDSYLFKGTLLDNLLLGNPDATIADIDAVLHQVNLYDFVRSQGGVGMPVAEGGCNLSGGQRQRIAIARALLHDSPVYVFDEATSNIDAASEEVIMGVVSSLARSKTVILVSHRLANVVASSRIYMVEGGRVAESGTHAELMGAAGPYAALFERQRKLEARGGGDGADA